MRNLIRPFAVGATAAALAFGGAVATTSTATAAPVTAASYSCGYYSGTATTQQGQTGSAAVARIKEVQCLINLGYYGNTLAVDGSFGPATLAGVKYYQRCSGITVDGIVGPNTWYQLRNNPNC